MTSHQTSVSGQRGRLFLEQLEPRALLAGFQPTAVEQLFLEQLNDARANPAAYGTAIGLNLNGVAPSQPLAFNPLLVQAARQHSQDMAARRYFDHYTPEGRGPGQRISDTGFVWNSYGESLAGGSAFPGPADALRGLIIDAGVPDLGHRKHLLAIDAIFRNQTQAGIGVLQNTGGPLGNYYTIDTASTFDSRPFVTGVVFRDGNNNGKYDLGEGLGGVTITVEGVGAVTTFDSGGYSIQANPGTYRITASGGAFGGFVSQTVSLGSTNARLNFNPSNGDPLTDDFVRKLYQSSLGRAASGGEVALWRSVIQAQGRDVVVNAIERSPEARTRLVKGWYGTFLGRQPGNGEEQSWVHWLVSGATEEQALAGILGSNEYYARAGQLFTGANGDERFVQSLFQQFLRRSASAGELAHWVGAILPALGRQTAASWVVLSGEYRTTTVSSYYTGLLRRSGPPSAGEIQGWVTSPYDLTTIRCGFKSSYEYYVNG